MTNFSQHWPKIAHGIYSIPSITLFKKKKIMTALNDINDEYKLAQKEIGRTKPLPIPSWVFTFTEIQLPTHPPFKAGEPLTTAWSVLPFLKKD
jgi:hypothetical protein